MKLTDLPKITKAKHFALMKKALTFAYVFATIASMVAVFIYAHINELRPGFVLMSFTFKFFAVAALFIWLFFYLLFLGVAKLRG